MAPVAKYLIRLGPTILCLLLFFSGPATAADPTADLDAILDGIENRYAGEGFSAKFFQESMLKAMQISDTAEGQLLVKRPDKMRWAYSMPDEQMIVSDGRSVWIYRPADKQVMVGKASQFFGMGQGAAFLSDLGQLRKSFKIELQPAENEKYHRLRLVPRKPNPDLAEIILSVERASHRIDQVVTTNAYGDETRIVLSDYQFNIDPEVKLFTFTIPKGVDVVQMDMN